MERKTDTEKRQMERMKQNRVRQRGSKRELSESEEEMAK